MFSQLFAAKGRSVIAGLLHSPSGGRKTESSKILSGMRYCFAHVDYDSVGLSVQVGWEAILGHLMHDDRK